MTVDKSTIDNYPINNIESIEILKGPETTIFGSKEGNGVVALFIV